MKLNKRAVALLCSLVVLMTAAVGATVAYLVDKSDEVENTFAPSRVACQVEQSADGKYIVRNTGDTTAYIRVAVVATWKNTENGNTYAQKPAVDIAGDTGWTLGKDGYYYYTEKVAKDAATSVFTVTLKAGSIQPDGYTLSVDVVASAIQATADAVTDWSSGVATLEDGKLKVTQGGQ